MPDQIERKLIDKRVAARYVKKGRLDEKEYERLLQALPDLESQALPIESVIEGDDLDDADDLDDEQEDELEAAAGTAPVETEPVPVRDEPPREG